MSEKSSWDAVEAHDSEAVTTDRDSLSCVIRDALLAEGKRLVVRRGAVLIRQWEATSSVWFIISGLTRVAADMAHGRQVVLALRGNGELVGEFAAITGRARTASVTTLTDVDAVVVDAEWFRSLLRREPDLSIEVMRRLVHRVDESDRRRMEAGNYAVPQRLARLLLEFARTHGHVLADGGTELSSLLTQDEIGSAIGATRESVVRALRELRERGIVRTSRRRIVVLRSDLLEAEARRVD